MMLLTPSDRLSKLLNRETFHGQRFWATTMTKATRIAMNSWRSCRKARYHSHNPDLRKCLGSGITFCPSRVLREVAQLPSYILLIRAVMRKQILAATTGSNASKSLGISKNPQRLPLKQTIHSPHSPFSTSQFPNITRYGIFIPAMV